MDGVESVGGRGMAKRFTDTEKWDKEWFRLLSPRQKCFWQFLCDKCDHAGIWSEDFGLASFRIGETVSREDYDTTCGHRIVRLDDTKVFIPRFIEFQYDIGLNPHDRKLNEKNKAHLGVIRQLQRNGIDPSPYVAPTKPLDSPSMRGSGIGIRIGVREGIGTGEGIREGAVSPIQSCTLEAAVLRIEQESGSDCEAMKNLVSIYGQQRIAQILESRVS